MSDFPRHKPPEWELFRNESLNSQNRRKALEDELSHVQPQPSEGVWWEDQRLVDQVVPAEMVHPDHFDHFNYRYQVYARQAPIQVPPNSLAEVTDEPPPIQYNVKRMAFYKPCASESWECARHWEKHQWQFEKGEEPQVTARREAGGAWSGCVPGNENQAQNNVNQSRPTPCTQRPPDCDVRSCQGSSSTNSCQSSLSGQANNNAIRYNSNNSSNRFRKNFNQSNSHNDGVGAVEENLFTDSQSSDKSRLCCTTSRNSSKYPAPTEHRNQESEVEKSGTSSASTTQMVAQDQFLEMYVGPFTCALKIKELPTDKITDQIQSLFYGISSSDIINDAAGSEFSEHDLPSDIAMCRNNNATNSKSSGKKEYILRGYSVQTCTDKVSQGNRLLCRPDKGSLDIPKDRVLIGRRQRKRLENEPYDEDKDGPLLVRHISMCPGEGLGDSTDDMLFVCEPPPKDPKPKPGYGTYKIIGSKQYREKPEPILSEDIGKKLPPDLYEYREFTRRCPNFKIGRYDHSDPINELLLPSSISTGLLKGSHSPFMFMKNPRAGKLPPLFEPEDKMEKAMEWNLPSFIVEEMNTAKQTGCVPKKC